MVTSVRDEGCAPAPEHVVSSYVLTREVRNVWGISAVPVRGISPTTRHSASGLHALTNAKWRPARTMVWEERV